MNSKINWKRIGQLVAVLLVAGSIKQYYSTASVNQLRWILAPTSAAVQFVTGSKFEFESYTGYVNSDHSFVIAASCAGVNFLITAFLMLALSRVWQTRADTGPGKPVWLFIPLAAGCAYLATVVANTVRIATAVRLHGQSIDAGGLNPNQLHRLEGIVIYFGFLLLLFVLSERVANRKDVNRPSLLRQSLFPLFIYYATALGVPLLNSVRHSGIIAADFWEHSAFVLVAPLTLVLPPAIFRWYRKIRTGSGSARPKTSLANKAGLNRQLI
ncbi:MAG TPA: exosortase K [Pyrinomonadaceae bacterium]|nr:exosortase K [Pyrinomonadaceae bacterium]